MNDKMIRFLKSIGIENFDDFDIEFEMINRDRFDNSKWNMIILKNTPWDYQLLRQFQDALQNINYPYMLRFSYLNRPDSDNVISLFNEWYQTLYRLPLPIFIEGDNDGHLFITYNSEKEKNDFKIVLEDFKDFLSFLCYEFVFTETIKEDDGPIVSKREMKKLVKEATPLTQESIQQDKVEQVNDRADLEKIREEMIASTEKEVEDAFLTMMKENYMKMKKERERARLNKRGNYIQFDFIDSIDGNSGSVDFCGKIFSKDKKEFRDVKKLTFGIYDNAGGAIYVNMNQGNRLTDEFYDYLKRGTNVRIRGVAYTDEYNKSTTIKGHFIDILPPDEIKEDKEPIKRVELHLHSNFSAMDGVSNMQDYCRYASALGHTTLSITDHAVVQGFPDAQKAAKDFKMKMLYGCEFYVIDDEIRAIKNPCEAELHNATYVVLDLETTGFSCKYNKIIEFGAVKVVSGLITERVDILINPEEHIPERISEITNINDEMLVGKPTIKEVLPHIVDFCKDAILVTHNAEFDISFLQQALKDNGMPQLSNPVVDTLALSRYMFPDSRAHNLGALCRNFEVEYDTESAHRADYDAKVLNDVWQPMIAFLTKNNVKLRHCDLQNLEASQILLKHIRPYHVIAFAKNKDGLKDLYKLVSISNTDYLADVPKLPRRILQEHRENLIIGSACLNGEVFNTARYYNEEKLKEVMKFYDYIEIQPPAVYSFLVNMHELSNEELIVYLKDIVKYAEEINIPVCATGDVHYATKEDKIFRDVYIFAPGLKGTNHPLNTYARQRENLRFDNPDQNYLSTEEMLEAMSFLPEEKAREVVITNTNKIADQIEQIIPVPNDKLYTPNIENVDETLIKMCMDRAHELYGDPLPEYIEQRLDKELNGITSNHYSVIYYIAHKLVKKANDDGYLVGSRGSVGSSFVATMAGITEVNPLPPHYRCPHCKHIEWTSEEYPDLTSGFDLPEKKCPICGADMVHDGQNIPFETFLGFHADKVPDIDLNFPGDYQARAHDYTKVLLGENNVFRAGTIETVADKTAFGFARGYVERMFISEGCTKEEAARKVNEYSRAKIGYLASGCVDVKRTTGQHPGGIIVIPTDKDVYDFTPIQYPADDIDAAWKTTHFDFHKIHDTVLKLDLLGHVDPMALKMMCSLTGINLKDIPMNDSNVISLFSSPEALKMTSDYSAAETGALAIPEFGTNFVRGILEETRPKKFSDLVIISGISHGTNVWNGNAQRWIQEGKATLQEIIGCRDDIMGYLIRKGIANNIAFSIMEDVRKGRGLKQEYEDLMRANKVPDFYIESCKLIKYLFPKGHAVAYVTMAVRVGFFKVYHPLEFYATFFSVRSKQYDIVPMINGKEAIIARLEELKTKSRNGRGEKLSPKEEEQNKTLEVALEMVQRGYSFGNVSLYKSDAVNFVVDNENNRLIPPFITLDNLGEAAAQSVIEARNLGKFTSKQDLLRRTKLSSTNVNDLDKLGVLTELEDTDQLSLFDF